MEQEGTILGGRVSLNYDKYYKTHNIILKRTFVKSLEKALAVVK
ncbi:hypothetical protein [Sporosarcina sp. P13]|nr:hypothetical protein [Sporosarcina sp. P13]